MKVLFFFFLIGSVLFISCSKGSNSVPQVSLKSFTAVIPFNGEFQATFSFTDKQGDLGNGTFVAIIIPTNLDTNGRVTLTHVITDTIPPFPNTATGEFDCTLPANSFQEQSFRNDSLKMQFVFIDRAGNKSDTLTTPLIVALYQ